MYVLWCQKDKVSCFVSQRCVWRLFVNNPTDPVHLRTDPNLNPASSTETQPTLHTHTLSSYTPQSFSPLWCLSSFVAVHMIRGPYGGAGWMCHIPLTRSRAVQHTAKLFPRGTWNYAGVSVSKCHHKVLQQ